MRNRFASGRTPTSNRLLRFAALAIGLTSSLSVVDVASAQGWFDSAWQYRRAITVANPGGSARSDYQVRVALDGSFAFANAASDGSDLRVASSDGVTLLPYWKETWNPAGSAALIWARVPSIPAGGTTIYLYYGDAAAGPASNGSTTFPLFDDSLWTQTNGNPVFTAGQSWWESMVSYPIVFKDSSLPGYQMLYDGHSGPGVDHGKGYATSSDLIHWSEYDNGLSGASHINPIMAPGYTGNASFAWGDVIKRGTTYHMFPSRGPGQTVHTESTDLIHWTGFETLISPADGSGIGTGVAILKQPDGITPVVVGGKYWMVYFHGFSPGSMYLASADASSDLLTWTTCCAGPILAPSTTWDNGGMWTPSFVQVGDSYYIYYQGSSGTFGWSLGFAKGAAVSGGNPVSPDNVTWTKSPSPVITGTHGWDQNNCQDPTLRQFDGTYYLFYTGCGGPWANGFCTATSPEGPWTPYGGTGGGVGWIKTGSSTVTNGVLSLANGSSLQSPSTYSPGTALGFRGRFYNNANIKWAGFISGQTSPFLLVEATNAGAGYALYLDTYDGAFHAASLGAPPGAYHVYEDAWVSSSLGRVFVDNATTASGSVAVAVPSAALPVGLQNFNDGTNTFDIDWVYVRKYAEPEPACTVGSEQTLAPPAPVATAATTVTYAGFTANWNFATGGTSYQLDVASDNLFASVLPAYSNLAVSGLSQPVSGLSPLTSYYYRVRAVGVGGPSVNSNTITVTTPGADLVAAVPAPGNCISTAHACVAIPVTFTRSNPTGMRGYSVHVTVGGGLTTCGTPFTQGPYLSAAGATTFQVVDNHDGSYNIDEAILGACNGGATGNGTLFTVNVGSAAASGTGTIALSNVRVRDCANVALPGDPGADASIVINNTPPAALTTLAAARVLTGNPVGQPTTGITVTYTGTVPAGGHVEVWRKRFGNYPEYDDGATPGSAPTLPASYPPAGWTPTAVTASGQVDAPGSRDFWYYLAYTVDACGNAAPSSMTAGALDYVLGDVHNGLADCAGDNRVDTSDISSLGAHYGATLGEPDALSCLDVGPTSTGYVDGRPVTDNHVDFEDLVLFAIDYEPTGGPALLARSRPAAASADALTLAVGTTPAVGETFEAVLHLAGAGDVQALSATLDYDAAVVEPVQVARGALLAQQAGPADVFTATPGTVDVAAFGRGQGLTGTGELARVTFRVKASGNPAIGLGKVSARDAQNRPLPLDGRATPGSAEPPPTQVMLAPSYPNPFTSAITVGFGMPKAGLAQLVAFDIQGRAVRHLVDRLVNAGWKRVTWDGRDDAGKVLAPGAYVIRLAVGDRVITKSVRMVR